MTMRRGYLIVVSQRRCLCSSVRFIPFGLASGTNGLSKPFSGYWLPWQLS